MRKTVTLIVCGSVSAVKAPILYNLLVKKYDVQVILTESTHYFIDEAEFNNVAKTVFIKEKFDRHDESLHITLAKKSDFAIVYPATYDYVGRIASGLADTLASLYFSVTQKSIFIFEAMNENMLLNDIYKQNKAKLKNLPNVIFHDAKYGVLANRDIGLGRLWEPEEVMTALADFEDDFHNLENKNIFINLGRTKQYLDTVRYISNDSSGKMGMALATIAKGFTKNINIYFGDNNLGLIEHNKIFYCPTNQKMLDSITKDFAKCDIFIGTMAGTDFAPLHKSETKIRKSNADALKLELIPDIDVLAELGKIKTTQFLVGFSLLDTFDIVSAREKMVKKNLDMIVLNTTSAMGSDLNDVLILNKYDDKEIKITKAAKNSIATHIYKVINQYIKK